MHLFFEKAQMKMGDAVKTAKKRIGAWKRKFYAHMADVKVKAITRIKTIGDKIIPIGKKIGRIIWNTIKKDVRFITGNYYFSLYRVCFFILLVAIILYLKTKDDMVFKVISGMVTFITTVTLKAHEDKRKAKKKEKEKKKTQQKLKGFLKPKREPYGVATRLFLCCKNSKKKNRDAGIQNRVLQPTKIIYRKQKHISSLE